MMADMLGSMHLNTLTSDFNLACNLTQQGKHAEAEPILRRVLAAWSETLGRAHPNTQQVANVLSSTERELQAEGTHLA